ncbi:hypothetical protein VE00_07273 [Pseudogymnoascus sp. WSF 3629]|nr:hypothetical protein VE00_07273 [Pseudogymnoascus sp. WSF 3629]
MQQLVWNLPKTKALIAGQQKTFLHTVMDLTTTSEHPKIIKSPIRIAVEKGNPEILDILLKNGANANESGPDGATVRSLLSLAIQKGDANVLDLLLKADADVVVGTLPSAIAKGKLDLVRCLLCAGALLKNHEDVLLPAIEAQNRPLVKMLLEHGAVIEPHHRSAAGTTNILSVVYRHPI